MVEEAAHLTTARGQRQRGLQGLDIPFKGLPLVLPSSSQAQAPEGGCSHEASHPALIH